MAGRVAVPNHSAYACEAPAPRTAPTRKAPWWVTNLVWAFPLVQAFPFFLLQFIRPQLIAALVAWQFYNADTVYHVILDCFRDGNVESLVVNWQQLLPITALLLLLINLSCDDMFRRSFGLPYRTRGPDVLPGIYHKSSPRNNRIAQAAGLEEKLAYKANPMLYSGDLTTVYPFVAFHVEDRVYERHWVKNAEDGERLALDWAYPSEADGGFDPSKPVLVILHGLNGGSQEKYLLHLVHEACARGWTCVVFIARGLMGTPITSGNFFHGARISDIHTAVQAVDAATPAGTKIAAAGYSMGAIVLNNYLAQIGNETPLCAAVTLAGCFDALQNKHFSFSRSLWQPYLAVELKRNFVPPFLDLFSENGCVEWDVHRSYDIVDFDTAVVVPLNGYKDVDEYYTDQSANCRGKLQGTRVPLLAVHACDDPIVDVNTMPVRACDENDALFMLVTQNGGHVGWPVGMSPSKVSFGYMTDAVLDFCSAVVEVAECEENK